MYISGLYLDGAKWDKKRKSLADQDLGTLYPEMPLISFNPLPKDDKYYNMKEQVIMKWIKKVETYR